MSLQYSCLSLSLIFIYFMDNCPRQPHNTHEMFLIFGRLLRSYIVNSTKRYRHKNVQIQHDSLVRGAPQALVAQLVPEARADQPVHSVLGFPVNRYLLEIPVG